MDDLLRLSLETIEKDKQALIFCPSRASAEKTAEEISKKTKYQLPEFEEAVLKAVSHPTKQCRRLSHCIKKGIAFHHSGLTSKQKEIIEEGFKNKEIKIIAATPTLAAGLSLPAFRVIIKSLKRFSGSWGMDWIPVLEYLQMAGRAGRPEYETFGEAIAIAKTESEKDEIYEKYVCGEPEEIYSKLAVEPVLRTYLLSLIASGVIRDEITMHDFFSKTFWAHQFKDMNKLGMIMERMLSLLVKWKFVTTNQSGSGDSIDSDFKIAASLGEKNTKESMKMRATLLGKRISELYLDPLTARFILDSLERYNTKKENERTVFSLLQMISHTLEMRPLLRLKKKDQDKIQEELMRRYELLLEEEPSSFDPDYDEFLNSIKTTLFFEAWINEKDEEYLFETFDIRPGEIRVKNEIANWLLYSSSELAKVSDLKNIVRDLQKLRVRVKNGAKEELLPLIRLKGVGRIRARKLFNNSIKDVGDLKKVDPTTLVQLVGKAITISLKKQVGEEITSEISPMKRKGQMSLQKKW